MVYRKNAEILYEYERLLMGEKKNISRSLFEGSDKDKQDTALVFIRYAVEYFLRWTPKQAESCLDEATLKLMKLDKVMPYIIFPKELNPRRDYFYLAHLLYPDKIKYTPNALTLHLYREILREGGDGENDKKSKFPKEYMSGERGRTKACVCFRYMLQNYCSDIIKNTRDMYRIFSEPKGTTILKKYGLYLVCFDLYDTPVDFVHDVLGDMQQDETLFFYYKFQYFYSRALSKIIRDERAEGQDETSGLSEE